MYRLTLRMTRDGLGFYVSERDVARLCLGEGDQLVVAEVVRVPAGGVAALPLAEHGDASPAEPARPPEAVPRSASPSASAPTLEERPEQTERDRTAFRRLVR